MWIRAKIHSNPTLQNLYHLESRWLNSHVLLYHIPLLSHLLGVAIYFPDGIYKDHIDISGWYLMNSNLPPSSTRIIFVPLKLGCLRQFLIWKSWGMFSNIQEVIQGYLLSRKIPVWYIYLHLAYSIGTYTIYGSYGRMYLMVSSIVYVHPEPKGHDPICAYVSSGLVQPPTSSTPEN